MLFAVPSFLVCYISNRDKGKKKKKENNIQMLSLIKGVRFPGKKCNYTLEAARFLSLKFAALAVLAILTILLCSCITQRIHPYVYQGLGF